ncbi:MAG: hypothetical protein RLZZ522_554 [Verrucomicrobiota bacterium]|jgi:uncharacterized membrane protein YqiK
MSASGSKGLLLDATRQLQARWAETRASWRDHKAEEFDETYLANLSANVHSALRVIDELEQILQKVRAECE